MFNLKISVTKKIPLVLLIQKGTRTGVSQVHVRRASKGTGGKK